MRVPQKIMPLKMKFHFGGISYFIKRHMSLYLSNHGADFLKMRFLDQIKICIIIQSQV